MAAETQKEQSVPLEGPEPITPEGNRLSNGPEPESINGKSSAHSAV